MTLNQLGASLFLKVLHKQMTPQMASSILRARKRPIKVACRNGPYGLCLAHGQLIVECKNDAKDSGML